MFIIKRTFHAVPFVTSSDYHILERILLLQFSYKDAYHAYLQWIFWFATNKVSNRMTTSYEQADRFCTKSKLDKAVHTIEGMLRGVAADGVFSNEEKNAIVQWVDEHNALADKHPFNEIIPALATILDKEDQDETIADILWLCEQMNNVNIYYDTNTSDMQTLQGIVSGTLADEKIVVSELKYLQKWILDHDQLKGLWPYDEIQALAHDVLEDGIIDEEEHKRLLDFFVDFQRYINNASGDIMAENMTVQGICAADPEIVFQNKTFCITGKSAKGTRKEFAKIIVDLGGKVSKGLSASVDYLIIGSDGSSCWSYSCYGRKIEAAMKLRKKGNRVAIVNEHSFWKILDE